jgi:hypothetical protein
MILQEEKHKEKWYMFVSWIHMQWWLYKRDNNRNIVQKNGCLLIHHVKHVYLPFACSRGWTNLIHFVENNPRYGDAESRHESDLLTHSLIELSPSWEAANCAATQEFPSILWNMKVYYHVHKSSLLVPILSQINPIHTIQSYLSKIHLILSTHLRLRLPSGLLPSGFPINILYVFLLSPIRATCPTHLVLLGLIILIILGEEYKLWDLILWIF